MKLLIKDRGTSKTTGLIYTSEATGYPIVTSSKIQACYIKDWAKDMNCIIPDPITVEELLTFKMKKINLVENVLFDNVETILEDAINSYLGVNVVCATMTDVEKENHQKKIELENSTEENEEVNEDV